MKHKPTRSPIKTREALPKVRKTKKGVELICPFCRPEHVLSPGKVANCGTEIKIVAVQKVMSQHFARQNGITCLKCKKSTGGELVSCLNGFVHTHDCEPGTVIMTEQPVFSKYAEYVFKLPDTLRKIVEKRTGEVKKIEEIDPEGNDTGKVLGYIFYKK